ncbi:hypothetical protein B0H66DRAFT_39976 [Apodospora peruviana]|uniref:BHLH domain-containing protein n=1 Tax=Apodospora peruviana TaxID=516989 RepID=A0AAE0IRN3_9PEZI|nr:hypothetical protein B0H66DRAFT_39976 [Apodospora peruviana]
MSGYPGTLDSPAFANSIAIPSGHFQYHASPALDSAWSPNTPAPPGAVDSLSGYFSNATGPPSYADSASISPMGMATDWSYGASTMSPGYLGLGLGWPARHSAGELSTPSLDEHVLHQQDSFDTLLAAKSECASDLTQEGSETARPQGSQKARGGRKSKLTTTKKRQQSESSVGASALAKQEGRRRSTASRESPQQSSPPPAPALRTATRRQPSARPSHKPGESAEDQRLRTSHNRVEKEYRNRLHKEFERLLEVLPEGEIKHVGDVGAEEGSDSSRPAGKVGVGRPGRRLSKADVLGKATTFIESLEGETERLRQEMREVEDRVKARKSDGS